MVGQKITHVTRIVELSKTKTDGAIGRAGAVRSVTLENGTVLVVSEVIRRSVVDRLIAGEQVCLAPYGGGLVAWGEKENRGGIALVDTIRLIGTFLIDGLGDTLDVLDLQQLANPQIFDLNELKRRVADREKKRIQPYTINDEFVL